MRLLPFVALGFVGAVLHCGGSDDATPGNGELDGGGSSGNPAGGDGSSAANGDGGSSGDDGGVPSSCEAFGHFGVPAKTFTLPSTPNAISYPDIQKSFPDVDWKTLERLYVPAGTYKTFQIGNLPMRDAASPLVITNSGGQVKVGPNTGGNFIWSMGGGSNWILTGRYDPDSKTGDAAFPGHRCGAYADSRGKYGFLSDDAFDLTAPYLHMGMAIGGGATDFEIEFVEVERSGFAGIRLLNATSTGAADPTQPMKNVRINDTYVHDTDAEGYYFGWTGDPPSYLFENLQIYNNRVIRTGNEALQIQDLGNGTRVHHNVFAFGALHWLDNGLGHYQDGLLQILTRQGTIEYDHNIAFGGAGTFLSFFSSPETNDGARTVTFHDNYFADTRDLGGYLNGSSTTGSSFTFAHNVFRGLDFAYTPVDPNATDPGVVFGINPPNKAPITFDTNTIEGSKKLLGAIALNGTSANITATNNVSAATLPAVSFVASGYPAVPTAKLSMWGTKATVNPNSPAIAYAVGDLVMRNGDLYRAIAANTNKEPSASPDAWEKLPAPTDDVRVTPASAYAGMGVQ